MRGVARGPSALAKLAANRTALDFSGDGHDALWSAAVRHRSGFSEDGRDAALECGCSAPLWILARTGVSPLWSAGVRHRFGFRHPSQDEVPFLHAGSCAFSFPERTARPIVAEVSRCSHGRQPDRTRKPAANSRILMRTAGNWRCVCGRNPSTACHLSRLS